MKTLLLATAVALASIHASAQAALPGTANLSAPSVDMQAVSQDEQAMVAALRHYIEDNGALAREVQFLRGETRG